MRDSWTETTLGEIAEIQQGQNLAISTLTTGKYPVYGANGIVGYFDKWNFDRDVVALGCRGSCGTVHSVTGKVWLANNAMAIWPKNESQMAVAFIALVLETAELRSSGVISGQVQPQITRTSLSPLALTCPPLSEQKRIVDVVNSVDAYIAALQQQADGARTARNAVLHELLTAGRENWTELTPNVRRFEEMAHLKRGHDLPIQSRKNGEYGVIASNGIVGHHNTNAGPIPGVITGRSGTIGKVFYIESGYWPLNTTLYTTDFMGNVEQFVALTLEVMRLENYAGGTTVPSLDRKVFRKELVYVPNVSEQKQIVATVSAIDKVIRSTDQAVSDAKKLRSGLLTDLLSGDHGIPQTYDRLLGAA